MDSQNDSIWQRLLISCGVMFLVAVVCISGFALASTAYLLLANN